MTSASGNEGNQARPTGVTRRLALLGVACVGVLAVAGIGWSMTRDQRELPPPPPPPSTTSTPDLSLDVSVATRGTTGTEQVEVWVGTHLVARFTASTSLTTEEATVDVDGDVEVRFVNDGLTEAGNRDLTVDHVTIGGQRFDSSAPTTVATGFWDPVGATCRSDWSNPEADTLFCNGAFRYASISGGEVVPLDEPSTAASESIDPLPPEAKFVATHGDDSGPGTESRPWRTIQHAADTSLPGDVIVVRAGTYSESVYVSRSGAPGARIEFRNYPGERPVVRATEDPGFRVEPIVPGGVTNRSASDRLALPAVSHVTIRGFDLAGENNTSANGWASGVSMGYANDIQVLDNVIHGFPGGGVTLAWSDNVLVEANQISDVGSRGLTQYSGVSAFQSVDRGGPEVEPGFQIVIRDNDVSGVRSRVTTAGKEFGAEYLNVDDPADRADDPASDGQYSDANCIIIDDGRNTQLDSPFPVYQGRTLVEGNTCQHNMGRGVHVFLSDRVLARENVLINNLAANRWYPPPAPFGHDPWKDMRWTAELNAGTSGDVRFENNTVDAAGGFDRNSFESSDVEFVGNRYVGGPIETSFADGATFTDETIVESG